VEIQIFRRNECASAHGLCVVIDVLRAFTTAAHAFSRGAKEIILVSSAEEAFSLKRQERSLVLMGEAGGIRIPGFCYGNSPAAMQSALLQGKRAVMRTSAGTQGVVACRHADHLLISSFVVAEATVRRIREISPQFLSLIVTGTRNGDEDMACAEYLQARLEGRQIAVDPFLCRVRSAPAARKFLDSTSGFLEEDLILACQIDRFSFAMEVEKLDSLLVAKSCGSSSF
jgi:2-phosphosulfolactate phosphatase